MDAVVSSGSPIGPPLADVNRRQPTAPPCCRLECEALRAAGPAAKCIAGPFPLRAWLAGEFRRHGLLPRHSTPELITNRGRISLTW